MLGVRQCLGLTLLCLCCWCLAIERACGQVPLIGPDSQQGGSDKAASRTAGTWKVVSGTQSGEPDSSPPEGPPGGDEASTDNPKKQESFATYLDKQLEAEFRNEEIAQSTKQDLNATLSREKGSHLEQVVKVSAVKKNKAVNGTEEAPAGGEQPAAQDPQDPLGLRTPEQEEDHHEVDPMEAGVDRLIDEKGYEYVLSRTKGGVTLTLDPLLIQDLTVVLSASSVVGAAFESIQQPVLNGYIIAGSLVSPDGFALVKELVQVETLAQVGVQLLLFGLGMEFSIEKLREVGSVAILGGLLQIVLIVTAFALSALAIGGALSEGIFVGCLVSMSSTSVVVKALGDSSRSVVSQIVIGTLILQDCTVGLMFALMPVLSSLNDPESGLDPEATGEMVLLVLLVLLKLALMLGAAAFLAQGAVPWLVLHIKTNYSDELFQMAIVGYCMSCAWICGKLGLSHELGAFLAGIMLSNMEQHEAVLLSTEQVRNVFTGLFLASIGLVISPLFILEHIRVLSLGALVILMVKSSLIALVVSWFKYSWTVSWTVGLSLAQVGEFAFVLLSLASQLDLVNTRLSMLLLGVTAISLLTTPLVLTSTNYLIHPDAVHSLPLTAANGSGRGGSGGSDHGSKGAHGHGHGHGGRNGDVRGMEGTMQRVRSGRIPVAASECANFLDRGSPAAVEVLGVDDLRSQGSNGSGPRTKRAAVTPVALPVSADEACVTDGGASGAYMLGRRPSRGSRLSLAADSPPDF